MEGYRIPRLDVPVRHIWFISKRGHMNLVDSRNGQLLAVIGKTKKS